MISRREKFPSEFNKDTKKVTGRTRRTIRDTKLTRFLGTNSRTASEAQRNCTAETAPGCGQYLPWIKSSISANRASLFAFAQQGALEEALADRRRGRHPCAANKHKDNETCRRWNPILLKTCSAMSHSDAPSHPNFSSTSTCK